MRVIIGCLLIVLLGVTLNAQTPGYFDLTVQLRDGKNILRDEIIADLRATVMPDNVETTIPSVKTNYDGYVTIQVKSTGIKWYNGRKTLRIQGRPGGSSANIKELNDSVPLPVAAYTNTVPTVFTKPESAGVVEFFSDNQHPNIELRAKDENSWPYIDFTQGNQDYLARIHTYGKGLNLESKGGVFVYSATGISAFRLSGLSEIKSQVEVFANHDNAGLEVKGIYPYLDLGSWGSDYHSRIAVENNSDLTLRSNGKIQFDAGVGLASSQKKTIEFHAGEHVFNGGTVVANGGVTINSAPLRVNSLLNYDYIYNQKRYLWMGWTYSENDGGKGEWGKQCKDCRDVNDAYDNIKWNEHDKNGTFDERISIISTGGISATHFVAHSDQRIKKNITSNNINKSEEILSKIRVTNYDLKDSLGLSNGNKLGVIAQEVEQVFPEAVSRTIGFIPNIYQLAREVKYNPSDRSITLTVDSLKDVSVGDKIRIITRNQQHEVFVSAVNGISVTIKDWPEMSTEEAFVYGKEINDFRVVDYDRIFTLNVSATQALIEKVETLEEQASKLQKENEILRADNREILKRLDALESSLKTIIGSNKPGLDQNNPINSQKK